MGIQYDGGSGEQRGRAAGASGAPPPPGLDETRPAAWRAAARLRSSHGHDVRKAFYCSRGMLKSFFKREGSTEETTLRCLG